MSGWPWSLVRRDVEDAVGFVVMMKGSAVSLARRGLLLG